MAQKVTDQMIDDLAQKVLPLAAEWKNKFPRGGYGKATCPLCGGTISYTVSGYNRHVGANCDGCWVKWQE